MNSPCIIPFQLFVDAFARTTSNHSPTSLTACYLTPDVDWDHCNKFTSTWCVFPRGADGSEPDKDELQVLFAPLVKDAMEVCDKGRHKNYARNESRAI
jgi:hypothetical protein